MKRKQEREKRKRSITFMVFEDEYDDLRKACFDNRETMSGVLRYYLNQYTQEWKENKK